MANFHCNHRSSKQVVVHIILPSVIKHACIIIQAGCQNNTVMASRNFGYEVKINVE